MEQWKTILSITKNSCFSRIILPEVILLSISTMFRRKEESISIVKFFKYSFYFCTPQKKKNETYFFFLCGKYAIYY